MRAALCLATVLVLQDAPPIGLIEIYGLRHVEEGPVRQAVGLKTGDAFPASDDEVVARLERVPGVAEARLEGVCCNDGRMVLFVGIREQGEHGLTFRAAPQGTVRLREDVVKAGAEFERAFVAAVTRGDAEEDRSRGYSLMKDPASRAIQQRFPDYATRDLRLLQTVLRGSAMPPSAHSPRRSSRTHPTRRRSSTTWRPRCTMPSRRFETTRCARWRCSRNTPGRTRRRTCRCHPRHLWTC